MYINLLANRQYKIILGLGYENHEYLAYDPFSNPPNVGKNFINIGQSVSEEFIYIHCDENFICLMVKVVLT